MTPAELVFILFALFVVGLFLEQRAEARRAKEAAEALQALMKIAKRDDEEGRQTRLMLMAWATTPPPV